MASFRKMSKKEKLSFFLKISVVILGSFFVSFGNVAFLVPLDINSGGLSGLAIIIRFFVNEEIKVLIYNLVVALASVALWVLGLIFIGKDFAFKTLIATIALPAANALFTLVPGVSDWVYNLGEIIKNAASGPTAGNYLLAGIFGGVFVGGGVAITFVGGGSTGGVDVLTFLMEKFLHIKQSIASFLVDGTIVIAGILILVPFENDMLMPCAAGILSAFVTAILIEFIYIGSQSSYQADIISDKWEDISKYVQDELGRGATIIPARGGYKGDERILLRVVLEKNQYEKLVAYIGEIDEKAFVTYTKTHETFGEGFKSHYKNKKNKK